MKPIPQPSHLTEPVPWGMFYAIVTIMCSVFFGWLSSVNGKVDRTEASQTQVLTQLSQIQADLKNLDGRLVDIRQDLNNKNK